MRELKGDWRDLFNGFMVALDLRKCFLALCGIFVTILLCGGITLWLGNALDSASVTPPASLRLHEWWNAQNDAWDVIYDGAYLVNKDGVVTGRKDPHVGIVIGYTVVFFLLLIAIWSYFGGAIARIAAYEIAKDGERIETRKALQFARKKFWSFFWAPLICLIGLGFFGLCNYVGGAVGSLLEWVYVGGFLVAILLPLALLSGFIMTLIALGTIAGLPLFSPAVAAEGTDSFDAVSRGFSYVYSRPWHYLGYQIVSAVYGYVCISFVIVFAVLMCHWGIKAGASGFQLCGLVRTDKNTGKGDFDRIANASWATILSDRHEGLGRYRWDPMGIIRGPHPYGRLQTVANEIVDTDHKDTSTNTARAHHPYVSAVITFWLVITLGLALGYVVSYAISQQTMIYYILRKKVDGIEMNEVFEETEEELKPTALETAKPAESAPAAGAPKAEDKPASPPATEEKK
jgi:hypothetical protein